jgi:hypothetical protein
MKNILLSACVASLLIGSSVQAKEVAPKGATVAQVNTVAVSNAKSKAEAGQAKLVKEAIASLADAHEALIAIEQKDAKKATKKLEDALGKLEVTLASKEVPKLLPIDSVVSVNAFVGTSSDIDAILSKVKRYINEGKVQEARALMLPLQSEIDITIVSLPLASYPDALKLAATYLHSNELSKAHHILAIALSTFTKEVEVMPIPLLKATDLIASASAIAKEDKKMALAYLEAANESLFVAQKLGYVSKSETTYKVLHEQIKQVKEEIEGPNKAEALFLKLKSSLKEFQEKIFSKKDSENK